MGRLVIKDFETQEILFDERVDFVTNVNNEYLERWIYVRRLKEKSAQ